MKRVLAVLIIMIGLLFVVKMMLLPFNDTQSTEEPARDEIRKTDENPAGSLRPPARYVPLVALKEPERMEKPAPPAKPDKKVLPNAPKKEAVSSGKVKEQAAAEGPEQSRKSGQEATMPNCLAHYEMRIDDYLAFMRSRGSRIIVYDMGRERAVCDGNLNAISNFAGFSGHSRRITDDFPQKDLLRRVEDKYGPGNYEVLLILPESLAERFDNSIKELLKTKGINTADVSSIHITYRGSKARVTVYIEKAVGDFGSIPINKAFAL